MKPERITASGVVFFGFSDRVDAFKAHHDAEISPSSSVFEVFDRKDPAR